MADKKVPRLPDEKTLEAMLPKECADRYAPLKANIKKILRINDEQLHVNSFKWYNLPPEISGNLIERILYYRGEGMLFYIPETKRFYFLPYTLNGSIDVYGRFMSVRPLPFMGKDELEKHKTITALLSTISREPVYDIDDIEGLTPQEFLATKCILIHDYSKQLSQNVQPRMDLNEGLIDIESNLIPYLNTMLSNNTGVAGLRVNSGDEQASVETASQTANLAALNGRRWIAIEGALEFQDLSVTSGMRAEDVLLAMQSLDNLRLSTHGLDNGGLFNKSSYQNYGQTAQMGGAASLVLEDRLYNRQRACDILNNYVFIPMGFGAENLVDCQISESAMGGDMNLDLSIGNEGNTDGEPSAQQATEGGAGDGNE